MYPAAFDLPNIVSVAAITASGGLASFSNYGRTSVDVAAPGVNILSTFPLDGGAPTYDYKSGTSMASPHVAGIAALIASANPSLTARQIRALIISTVRPLRSLKERCQTGGTVDAAKAVTTALNKPRRLEVYGKVRTARGAPVADVTVLVRRSDGKGRSRRAVSQADGSFIVTGIPPGNYVISASRANTNFKRRTFSLGLSADYKVLFTVR
jgi:subtilisin family serine protease